MVAVAAAAACFELNQLAQHRPAQAPESGAKQDAKADEQLSRKERKKLKAEAREAQAEDESPTITGATLVSAGAAFLLPLLQFSPMGLLNPESVLMGVGILAFLDALFFETDLPRTPHRVGLAVLGAVYCGLAMAALVHLRALENGAYWIVLTLVVTWFNDTGAYFAGRAFGKHKLFERISPKKTWEGAIGGFLACIAGGVGVQMLFLHEVPVWGAAVIGAAAGIAGPLGDLGESMLKRAYGVKDSGKLLPGHGGMLDRIDALLFTAPVVWLLAQVLGF
ncbi:MAG: phosphatidate cytidylyltransferase [Deltaproteobacteria bacterium]|nr:phosphatidate cytidylyltransferase [Deltaproteobacteria bacterium]